MEDVRTIVTSYIVVSEKGPLALGNKQQAEAVFEKAKQKGWQVELKELNTNTARLNELGRNLFSLKVPEEANSDPIGFRNKLINELHEYIDSFETSIDINREKAWKHIADQNGLDMTLNEFHSCMMDRAEYYV